MDTMQKVEKCLENIRPALEMHQGNVELVEVDEKEGVVKVRLEGACKGCPMSQVTLKMGIEAEIISQVPSIKQVVAIEDEHEHNEEKSCCSKQSDEDKWFYELLGQKQGE
tara:strand:- start:422 stop:751 length:330 start_codon:yes stop_codon:yes gene_type:complete